MELQPLRIRRIDSQRDDLRAALAELRARLSLKGNIVSQAGRQKTIEVFGEPLTPAQVVERICQDVAQRGMPSVLDYSARIDKSQLTAATVRVPAEELTRAHAAAEPEFLAAVRRIRQRIWDFQKAILHHDVRQERPGGYLVQRYRPLRRAGICVPGGGGRVSVDRADDGRARPGGRRARAGRRRSAHAIRFLQRRSVGHLP